MRGRLAVRRTRTGGLWVALVTAAFVLLLLLIFVLQNSGTVGISFMGAHGSLPLGIALLFAAIAGVLIVAVPDPHGSSSSAISCDDRRSRTRPPHRSRSQASAPTSTTTTNPAVMRPRPALRPTP